MNKNEFKLVRETTPPLLLMVLDDWIKFLLPFDVTSNGFVWATYKKNRADRFLFDQRLSYVFGPRHVSEMYFFGNETTSYSLEYSHIYINGSHKAWFRTIEI